MQHTANPATSARPDAAAGASDSRGSRGRTLKGAVAAASASSARTSAGAQDATGSSLRGKKLTLIALILAIFSTLFLVNPAQSQVVDVCTGAPIAQPASAPDFPAGTVPQCNNSRGETLGANGKGVTGWRYCKQPDGKYRIQWFAATWEVIGNTPGMFVDYLTAGGAATPNTTIVTLADKYKAQAKPLASPELAAVWCPFRPQMQAQWPAPDQTPTGPVTSGAVTANGTSTTRPAYTVTNGRRSQIAATTRATVGRPCVPSILSVTEGSFFYAAWVISDAAPGVPAVTSEPLVTSCTRPATPPAASGNTKS